MFDFRDLFQWDRFITPSIIKIFYWLAVGISTLIGLYGMLNGLLAMAVHPLAGLFAILASMIGVLIGVVFFFVQRTLESGAVVFDARPLVLAWLPTGVLAAAALVLIARTR